jgi:hypothetical protein
VCVCVCDSEYADENPWCSRQRDFSLYRI